MHRQVATLRGPLITAQLEGTFSNDSTTKEKLLKTSLPLVALGLTDNGDTCLRVGATEQKHFRFRVSVVSVSWQLTMPGYPSNLEGRQSLRPENDWNRGGQFGRRY